MTPDLVADVGNSRVKWGLCVGGAVTESAALSHDPEAWAAQLTAWSLPGRPLAWALSGVVPATVAQLRQWAEDRGGRVAVLTAADLPLAVRVAEPARVGIDRLLMAVGAAVHPARAVGRPAVLVGAGTAVTVDLLGPDGSFHGGAILPGLALMARSLHEHTALLPLLSPDDLASPADYPARDTRSAMRAGVRAAVVGAIERLRAAGPGGDCFLAGGDAAALLGDLGPQWVHAPLLALEGVRRAAEGLP